MAAFYASQRSLVALCTGRPVLCPCAVKNVVLLALVATLSSCASMRVMPAGVSGNEAYVSISNVWNSAEALPYATKHCAQYGKVPRMKHSEGYSVVFDCVVP